MTIDALLGRNGLLSQRLKGFEFRSSQIEMARLVGEAILKKIPAVVEAGTGTGKTFGYLIPVILSGKKSVISTGTKNLQDQIYLKDLPMLEEILGQTIHATMMKGRTNYLCLFKYRRFFMQASALRPDLEKTREVLEAWLRKTEFGDRAELPWMQDEDEVWDGLTATSDQCLGSRCPEWEACFLNRLRAGALRSRIVIVNHHLFFADQKVRRSGFAEIIPRFQVVVFDEAHDVEDIATAHFGESLSTRQLGDFSEDLEKDAVPWFKGKGRKEFMALIENLKGASERLRRRFAEGDDKARLDTPTLEWIRNGPAKDLAKALRQIRALLATEEGGEEEARETLAVRAERLEELLGALMQSKGKQWLHWYERRKRTLMIYASPLNIAEAMQSNLFDQVETAVFTSATLSAGGRFHYIRDRLGVPPVLLEGLYPSEFDFEHQALLYLPKDLPAPAEADFAGSIARRIGEILERTAGRALVLFTSHANMNFVYHALQNALPYTLLRQGDAPKTVLLDTFREDVHSVLLATGSFWQGVDVPGEALSCLIVDKLPFESPGEPLVAARIEAMKEEGRNPFMDYQLPSAIILLKQGLGRLIRRRTDRGVLSVLDVRILKSRYGKFFLESLPPMRVTHELSDIAPFMNALPKEGNHVA